MTYIEIGHELLPNRYVFIEDSSTRVKRIALLRASRIIISDEERNGRDHANAHLRNCFPPRCSPMTSMPSFTMSGASQQNQHTTSSMSSLSTGSGMSPMGMTVGMTVGPSPGACLQQRDNGYSCGVARPPSYEPLHLGYGARPTCSPTQPYHAASLNQYNQNASSTGECLPHSLHSLLAL